VLRQADQQFKVTLRIKESCFKLRAHGIVFQPQYSKTLSHSVMMKRFPGRGMSEIRVHCYSGYRADERPTRFTIRDREYNVEEVDDQWCSPSAMYFRVRANDGNYYVLRHDGGQDGWTLDGYRQALDRPITR
jgi:hypothetical protein